MKQGQNPRMVDTSGSEPQKREAMLLAELQHRVRNTLATTRMIARQSAETSESLEDYVAHLDGRLDALARVQTAAIRDPMAGIDFGLLVSDEVISAGLGTSNQVRTEGPLMPIHPRAAEPYALALHELMINALKFGALSTPQGRLAITWRIEEGDGAAQRLTVDWTETGMHLVDTDRRRGFGSIVLSEMLKHNLGAQTRLHFLSTGLICQIVTPLDDRTLPQKT